MQVWAMAKARAIGLPLSQNAAMNAAYQLPMAMLNATLGTGMPSQTISRAPFSTALTRRSSSRAESPITAHQSAGICQGITGVAAIAIAALVVRRIGMLRLDARNRRDAAATSACADAVSPPDRGDCVMPAGLLPRRKR